MSQAYVAPILAASFTCIVGLVGWTVRELARLSTQISVMEQRQSDHERRIERLEGL
jgi:hypothetical protein